MSQICAWTHNRQQQVTNRIAAFNNVTKRKLAEESLHHLAHFDALTGCAIARCSGTEPV